MSFNHIWWIYSKYFRLPFTEQNKCPEQLDYVLGLGCVAKRIHTMPYIENITLVATISTVVCFLF